MKVKIINSSPYLLPRYETLKSAGMDLMANIDEVTTLHPGQTKLISTGIRIELPDGVEAQIRSRSGLAIKHGVVVINSPGTIDPDYRGEIMVGLKNTSDIPVVITQGMRVAQMIFSKFERVEWESVDELSETKRGSGGFGSTGL